MVDENEFFDIDFILFCTLFLLVSREINCHRRRTGRARLYKSKERKKRKHSVVTMSSVFFERLQKHLSPVNSNENSILKKSAEKR